MPDALIYRSQQKAPDAPETAISGVRAPHFDTSTLADAVSKFGDTANSVAVALAVGQEKTRVAQAKAEYISGIEQIETRATNDPDFQNAPKIFAQDRAELEEKLKARDLSDVSRAELDLWMTDRGTTSKKHVERAALARELDSNVAGLTTRGEDYLKRVANAGSGVERQAAIASWNDDIDDMAHGGWITQESAARRKITAARAVDAAEITLAIKNNPGRAQVALLDPGHFPNVLAEDRAGFVAAAEASAADADWRAASAPVAAAMSMLRQGKIETASFADVTQRMSETAARAFHTAVNPPPGRDDPARVWSLMKDANDNPDGALVALVAARGAGAVSARQFDIVAAHGDQVAAGQPPYLRTVRSDMLDTLKPSDYQDRTEAARQIEAVAEFDAWAAQHPNATEKDARDSAEAIATAARLQAAKAEREKLPLPLYATTERAKFDRAALGVAAARLREKFNAKFIGEPDFLAEVEGMKRWHDLMAREGKQG